MYLFHLVLSCLLLFDVVIEFHIPYDFDVAGLERKCGCYDNRIAVIKTAVTILGIV